VASTSEDFTLKSHISNYVSKKEEIDKKHGAMYEYCALGASSATLPFKEVITYLASKMFREFSNASNIKSASVSDAIVSKENFDDFVARNGLGYAALENQLKSGVNMAFPIPDVLWKDALSDDGLTTGYFSETCLGKAEKALTKNFEMLTREIHDYGLAVSDSDGGDSKKHRSITGKVFHVLRAIMLSPEKGPHYASAILRNTLGGDLIALFSSHIEQARTKLQQELVNIDKLEEERINAQDAFLDGATSMFNGKKRYVKYCHCSREHALLQARIAVYSKMVDAMECAKNQLNKLANDFLDVFRDVIDRLINTFSSNEHYLESTAAGRNIAYEFPIARIEDLTDSLDRTIKSMEVGEKMSEFMSLMLEPDGIKAWITGNENDIVRLVTKYFTSLFNENSKKTMTAYLQEKYKTVDPEHLKKSIREDIMKELEGKSTPLFWTSNLYDINSSSRVGFISIPSESSEVIEAAKSLSNKDESLTVRVSEITDRITVMRCLVGVPLYGYLGLLQYENRSAGSSKIGKHLYEGRQIQDEKGQVVNGRNWHMLPSPSPLSTMNSSNNAELKLNAENARKLYEQAEARNIIVKSDSGKSYWLKVISQAYVEQVKSIFNESIERSAEVRHGAFTKIKSLELAYKQDEVYEIENDGYAELPEVNKRDVRIDHFAAAPKYWEVVREQFATLDLIDKMMGKLAPKVDADFDDFSIQIFAGIITIDNNFIKYNDSLTGEDVLLSKPSMPMGAVPFCQALDNYRKLDAHTKQSLKECAVAILDEYPIPTRVNESVRIVDNELSQAVLQRRLSAFAASNPEKTGQVRVMLMGMKEKLASFKSTYLNQ